MNRRSIARTAGSLALIVLSTSSTATDCEDSPSNNSDQANSKVVVRADKDACWKVTVDDRTRSGCGDATFYAYRSDDDTEIEKVNGDEIIVTVIVNGKTVYKDKVKASGTVVRVKKVETVHKTTKTYTYTSDDEGKGNES